MRALLVAVLTFLLCGLGFGVLEARETEEARLRARVREYTDRSTGEARRAAIARGLADADPAALGRLVREALVNEQRRAPALGLAARVALAGVFDAARRHADGPAEREVLALALAAPEPDAAAWLADRWSRAPPGSAQFTAVDEVLRTLRAPPAVAELLVPALSDPARAEAALAVLRVQAGVDDARPADLAARWPALRERFRFEACEFPRDGEDVLGVPGWRLRAARGVARNVRLPPRSWIDLPAAPFADGAPGTLRLRIVPGGGRGAWVALAVADGRQELRVRADGEVWFLVEGGAREGARVEVPCRPGAWQEVEFRISDPALRDRPGVRDVRVAVDGAEMRPSGGFWRLAAPPASLSIGSSDGAEPTVVGGATWRPEVRR